MLDASRTNSIETVEGGDELVVAGRSFHSRLFLGTGKYPSNESLSCSIEAAGAEIVTVALRRIDPSAAEDILAAIPQGVLLLTNTSGAVDAAEAVRLARLARAAGLPEWIKLEVTPDPRYLLPDPVETLIATRQLCEEGFTVLPYCPADPLLCRHLAEAGAATVMPLGSWIGSNQGLRTKPALEIIIEQASVPVVIDAGLGAPSHAAEAMEMGADAVLVNTAIGTAGDPPAMARAFRLAVDAGRRAWLAGVAGTGSRASASSPLTGFLARLPSSPAPQSGAATGAATATGAGATTPATR